MPVPFLILLTTCVAALLSACTMGSDVSCVAPEATLSPSAVSAGDVMTITGSNIVEVCRDTGNDSGSGVNVTAVMEDGDGLVWEGEARADADGHLALTVSVPDEASPGNASVELQWQRVDGGAPETASLSMEFTILD